eukprot:4418007-Pyramimonas_sp.AAC.1
MAWDSAMNWLCWACWATSAAPNSCWARARSSATLSASACSCAWTAKRTVAAAASCSRSS